MDQRPITTRTPVRIAFAAIIALALGVPVASATSGPAPAPVPVPLPAPTQPAPTPPTPTQPASPTQTTAEGVTARPPAPAVTEAARAQFASFTMRSARTLDLRGIEPSLYRGRYFDRRVEAARRCIIERESEGFYNVRSRSGYYGAYQMSPELADGATWMMLPEARARMGAERAKSLMAELRRMPPHTWPRYWQDAAFFTVYNWEGTGSGAAHWAGGRWHCAPVRA